MLPYFPIPYEDELWYSVLCRYHVRSGNRDSATTFRNLFEDREYEKFSTFLPNDTITKVLKQLPAGLLDAKEIALNHTLFNYVFRFQKYEDKEELLSKALSGRINFPVKIQRPNQYKELKYCPICVLEDEKKYGEAYWHTSHQIPYVTVCIKHRCKLEIVSGLKSYTLNSNLILPQVDNTNEPDMSVTALELEWTEMLTEYLRLPMSVCPTNGYNNLYEGLLNAGYGKVRKDHYFSIDYEKLGKDLCDHFGKGFIEEHFNTSKLRAAIMGNLRRWLFKMPERYAVIAIFLKQDPQLTFGTKIENKIEKGFMELKKGNIKPKKQFIADRLGLTKNDIDILAYNLKLDPFWEQRLKNQDPKKYRASIYFTKDEWDYMQDKIIKSGFQSPAAFLRYCLHNEMNKG